MKNMLDYIDEYGNYSFKEKPFNEVDNIIFSQLVYTDYKDIADNEKGITLKKANERFNEIYTKEEITGLISISVKSAELLEKCSKTKRYANTILCHYVNHVNVEIDKQFSALHFLTDDGNDIVAFRGTDVTVTGVKESAMLSYMFPVPAQIAALYYFQETAMMHDGGIILCGHSKGGNLAVFAAVNCSNSLKKRLVAVYENDAPGFPKYFFDRYDYMQIKDRIYFYTPQGSIIGRMLYHDAKSTIVHSENSGLKQHQVSSWEVQENSFVTVDKYEHSSDFLSDYINELIDYISDEELELFFDTLEYVANNMGIEDFYDTKEFDIKKALSLIDSLTTLDDEHKTKFKMIFKKALADFTKEYLSRKKQDYLNIFEKRKLKKHENEKIADKSKTDKNHTENG